MFEKNYYCLVAGLKEYTLDSDTKGFDARAILSEIFDEISGRDAAVVRLLYGYYDCENLIAARSGSGVHNPLGNFSAEEMAEQAVRPVRLPEWMARVVRAADDPEGEDAETVDLSCGFERALLAAYYEECARSGSRFLREWAAFDRNLRNVVAALRARDLQRPVEEVTVGGGDIVEQLERSSAADFGLRGELPYVDAVIAAADETNILDKEHKIDNVRWAEAEQIAWSDYFNIDAVLAYLVRVNIVARWMRLDEKRGRQRLAELMAALDGKELVKGK